jgi:hypothetical protein
MPHHFTKSLGMVITHEYYLLYMFRLCGSPVSWVRYFGTAVLALFASNHVNKRRDASSIAYWRISWSWTVLPHIFLYIRTIPEKPVLSDLGSQLKEVLKQSGRLPAEGRLGSSINTSNYLFYCSLHMCHLFGIHSPVS